MKTISLILWAVIVLLVLAEISPVVTLICALVALPIDFALYGYALDRKSEEGTK